MPEEDEARDIAPPAPPAPPPAPAAPDVDESDAGAPESDDSDRDKRDESEPPPPPHVAAAAIATQTTEPLKNEIPTFRSFVTDASMKLARQQYTKSLWHSVDLAGGVAA